MKKLFLATAVFFVAFASHAASFDCEKASTLVEKTICQDPELSHLDELLTQTYKTALNATKEPAALKSQQKAWRTNVRNKCLDSVCVMHVSIKRMNELYNIIAAKHPWLYKYHPELKKAECMAARQHDRYLWWGKGKCRMGSIRYAFGVAIRDTTDEDVKDGLTLTLKKGEVVEPITQFLPVEGHYCMKGGGCAPAKVIQLLGSVISGNYSSTDRSDLMQGVISNCALIIADRKNIVAANLQEMMDGCR
jgi:uncharacterized protein YecT (DUF1311 family)